jgi:hypothetical protein
MAAYNFTGVPCASPAFDVSRPKMLRFDGILWGHRLDLQQAALKLIGVLFSLAHFL